MQQLHIKILLIIIIVINTLFTLYFISRWFKKHQIIWIILSIFQLILIGFSIYLYIQVLQRKVTIQNNIVTYIIILAIFSVFSNVFAMIIYLIIERFANKQIHPIYQQQPPTSQLGDIDMASNVSLGDVEQSSHRPFQDMGQFRRRSQVDDESGNILQNEQNQPPMNVDMISEMSDTNVGDDIKQEPDANIPLTGNLANIEVDDIKHSENIEHSPSAQLLPVQSNKALQSPHLGGDILKFYNEINTVLFTIFEIDYTLQTICTVRYNELSQILHHFPPHHQDKKGKKSLHETSTTLLKLLTEDNLKKHMRIKHQEAFNFLSIYVLLPPISREIDVFILDIAVAFITMKDTNRNKNIYFFEYTPPNNFKLDNNTQFDQFRNNFPTNYPINFMNDIWNWLTFRRDIDKPENIEQNLLNFFQQQLQELNKRVKRYAVLHKFVDNKIKIFNENATKDDKNAAAKFYKKSYYEQTNLLISFELAIIADIYKKYVLKNYIREQKPKETDPQLIDKGNIIIDEKKFNDIIAKLPHSYSVHLQEQNTTFGNSNISTYSDLERLLIMWARDQASLGGSYPNISQPL